MHGSGSEALLTLFTLLLLLLGVEYYLVVQADLSMLEHPLVAKVAAGLLRIGSVLRVSFLTYLRRALCAGSSYEHQRHCYSPFVRMDYQATNQFGSSSSNLLSAYYWLVFGYYRLLVVPRFGRRQLVGATRTGCTAS